LTDYFINFVKKKDMDKTTDTAIRYPGTDIKYPGTLPTQQVRQGSNRPLNLQSPLISTRSKKEKSIDNDLLTIASGLEAVSMGVFAEDTYSSSYYQAAIGEIVDLSSASVDYQEPLDASVGSYILSQENGEITTSGGGTGLIINVSVALDGLQAGDGALAISVRATSGGQGFSVDDVLTINTTSIGGTNEQGIVVFTIIQECLDSETNLESYLMVSGFDGIELSSDKGIFLRNLPMSDPMITNAYG